MTDREHKLLRAASKAKQSTLVLTSSCYLNFNDDEEAEIWMDHC